MDFNVGLCKPSQTGVFVCRGRGGSQVLPSSRCVHRGDVFFAFPDSADASILSVALSCVCGSLKC